MNNPARIYSGLCLALVAASAQLQARDIPVKNAAELGSALAAAEPGDVLVMAKGEWKDAALEITKGGTAEKPLTLRAEIPGETIMTGASSLRIKAPHIVVDGLYFTRGGLAAEASSVIHFLSHHGTLKNTAIVDFNPANFEDDYYWVFFEGDDNLVERCYFKGKNNMQPLLGNAVTDSHRNTVRGCYFKNIPHADGNGREILRMWGPGKFDPKSEDGAWCVVEGNLFEGADGEGTEIVSLKSNHNKLVGNTVIATRGCLNIRQGSHNLVKGNIILGRGVPGAQGLRMSGLHNTVEGNFISGCDWGIKVMAGEFIERALTPDYKPTKKKTAGKGTDKDETLIAKYPQVKDLSLSGNIAVGNTGPDLEMGFGYKRRWPAFQMVLMPEDCLVKDNRFVRPQGGPSVIGTVPETAPPLDMFRFESNRYEGNVVLGGTVDYPPAEAGCKTEPMPAGWKEETEMAGFKPLTASDVGPPWVIALRNAGRFTVEDDRSCFREDEDSDEKNKQEEKE
jgi:poly(beta-D-mannuronate) lyase